MTERGAYTYVCVVELDRYWNGLYFGPWILHRNIFVTSFHIFNHHQSLRSEPVPKPRSASQNNSSAMSLISETT